MTIFTKIASKDNRLDYKDRQNYANDLGCDAYIEFHYNGKEIDRPGILDNPATILVADNSSYRTRDMASALLDKACSRLGLVNGGVKVLRPSEAGYWNTYYASGNSMLLELLWVSDQEQAAMAADLSVQLVLADCIREMCEEYEVTDCALSLGHKFKATDVNDKGAPVFGQDYSEIAEADLAEELMDLLLDITEPEAAEPEAIIAAIEGLLNVLKKTLGI